MKEQPDGERIQGKVNFVTFVPSRIGGPLRVFVFEYARSLNLVGETNIVERKEYISSRIDMSKH